MSVLYSILKPIIKKVVKENINQETYKEFAQVSRELQAKFKFQLPQKKGYKFRDDIIDGCHCIVGHKLVLTPKEPYYISWEVATDGIRCRKSMRWSDIWKRRIGICG